MIDVLIYSFEEGYNFASQSSLGVGAYNYSYVFHDPFLLEGMDTAVSEIRSAIENSEKSITAQIRIEINFDFFIRISPIDLFPTNVG